MKSRGLSFYNFFFRFWWTILLIILCYGFYLHAMHKKRHLLGQLKTKITTLETQLADVLEVREDLILQLESQTDPAWIEMLLKKNLGMVPMGQKKIYFYND